VADYGTEPQRDACLGNHHRLVSSSLISSTRIKGKGDKIPFFKRINTNSPKGVKTYG